MAISSQKTLEDLLAYLPCSGIASYKKGRRIYTPGQPAEGIYLVIDGTVSVSRFISNVRQYWVEIYTVDEFFGESSLLGAENVYSTRLSPSRARS